MSEKRTSLVKGILTVVVLAAAACLLLLGKVSFSLEGDTCRVSATMAGSETFSTGDITAIELRDHFDPGSRTVGVGNFKLNAGSFRNDEFGAYRLFVHKGIPAVIIVTTEKGRVVFNQATSEKTEAAYAALKKAAGL